MQRAAFLDRDGVLNFDDAYVHKIEDFRWIPGALEGARRIHESGFALIIVTNQSGIGRGYYAEEDFKRLTDWMSREMAEAGAPLAGVYFCPHHPTKAFPPYLLDCGCRKPEPGMLLKAAEELDLDLSHSVIFGDKPGDCTAGKRAGCPERVLLGTNADEVPDRTPDATRVYRGLAQAAASDWWAQFSK